LGGYAVGQLFGGEPESDRLVLLPHEHKRILTQFGGVPVGDHLLQAEIRDHHQEVVGQQFTEKVKRMFLVRESVLAEPTAALEVDHHTVPVDSG